MAQLVDFVVDGGILLNVGVRAGNVGFRLVVIVVADEILHRVLREKFPELGTELGRQRLVVGQHQGGLVHPGDDVCHGKGLAGAGDAQKRLGPVPPQDPLGQLVDGLRLVAGRLIIGH